MAFTVNMLELLQQIVNFRRIHSSGATRDWTVELRKHDTNTERTEMLNLSGFQ
jgi:hypothetical protein